MARRSVDRPFDPFEDFDRMFEEMRRRMDEMMRAADTTWYIEAGPSTPEPRKVEAPRTPMLRNVPLAQDGEFRIIEGAEDEEQEEGLLVDVIDRGGSVTVMMEMPGICSEDVKADIKGKQLRLDIDAREGRIVKMVELPCNVKPASLKVACRNGVLIAEMSKQPARKPRKRVKDPSLA